MNLIGTFISPLNIAQPTNNLSPHGDFIVEAKQAAVESDCTYFRLPWQLGRDNRPIKQCSSFVKCPKPQCCLHLQYNLLMVKGCNSADDSMPGCRNSRNAQRLILIPIDQAHRKAIMSSSTLPAVTTTAPLERPNILRNLALFSAILTFHTTIPWIRPRR